MSLDFVSREELYLPKRSAQKRLLLPSNMLTMSWSSISCRAHTEPVCQDSLSISNGLQWI